MASTTFIDGQSVIYASWLNDVNSAVYNGTFPNGSISLTNLNVSGTVTGAGFTTIVNSTLLAPGAIGSATPNTGKFTTLQATTGTITTVNATTVNSTTINATTVKSTSSGVLPLLQDSTGNSLQSKTTNGYVYLSGGLILQWGQTPTVTHGTSATITFPVSFPSAVVTIQLTGVDPVPNNAISAPQVSAPSTTSFSFQNLDPDSNYSCFWFAIGY
jgi:hypothetical protein